jgi:ferric enterobactin receptor
MFMRKFLQLLPLAMLLFCCQELKAQSRTISGTVQADDDNSNLQGVTVTNRNAKKSVQTNKQGFYTIAAETGNVLVFTFIGYAPVTATVGEDRFINIKLTPSDKQLGEVTVTAYGIKREKRSLGYATQEVKGEEIAQTRRENFINSLAGRVAGATVTTSSGVPGASTSIVLRGATSIGGNNQPLIVVDGVPYDNQTMNQENLLTISTANRNSDYSNRAIDLSSEDIDNVTILKGPEATALYGADGASGVIIVTTKKGKEGKGSVTYDNSFRFERVYLFPETQKVYGRGTNGVANPLDQAVAYGEANVFSPRYFGGKYAPTATIYDNPNAFFRTGITQQHNLSFEGGTKDATFRLSTGYLKQAGVIPSSGFTRLSLRLSSFARISPRININSSVTYVSTRNDKVTRGLGSYMLTLLQWPADDDVTRYLLPNGSRKTLLPSSGYANEYDNPFWDVNKNDGEDKTDRFTGNVTFNWDMAKWLSISNTTGIDAYTTQGYNVVHPQSRYGVSVGGYYSAYVQNTRNISNVSRMTLKKNFGIFTNTLTAGFAVDLFRTKIDALKGERFAEPDISSINNTEPTTRNAQLVISEIRKTRMFANYILGVKMFYASFSASREGDSRLMSRFVEKNPFYNYGSATGSFVFSDLLKDWKWLDLGKLRVSYASTGKAPGSPYIIDYSFQSQITTGGGYAFGVTGGNFGIQPEATRNFEYGAEFRFFKKRLGLDVAIYSLKSKNQILAARSSYGTGSILKYLNGGLVENRGVEVQLTGTPIQTKNLTWDLTFNFDRNRGQIIEMPASLPSYYDSDTWVYGNLRSQAAKGTFTGNLAGNTFRRNNRGDILISPTTGLPLIDANFTNVGNRAPDFKLGIINSINWKNFTLSFNIDIRRGGDVFNGTELALYRMGLSTRSLDREQPRVITGVLLDGLENTANPTANTITINPYLRNDYYTAAIVEENFIETVNWIRMRDITLSFNLPKSVLSRQKFVRNARFFLTATDVFMISNYTGADPSVSANTASSRGFGGAGIDYLTLSTPRGINVGMRVQF